MAGGRVATIYDFDFKAGDVRKSRFVDTSKVFNSEMYTGARNIRNKMYPALISRWPVHDHIDTRFGAHSRDVLRIQMTGGPQKGFTINVTVPPAFAVYVRSLEYGARYPTWVREPGYFIRGLPIEHWTRNELKNVVSRANRKLGRLTSGVR